MYSTPRQNKGFEICLLHFIFLVTLLWLIRNFPHLSFVHPIAYGDDSDTARPVCKYFQRLACCYRWSKWWIFFTIQKTAKSRVTLQQLLQQYIERYLYENFTVQWQLAKPSSFTQSEIYIPLKTCTWFPGAAAAAPWEANFCSILGSKNCMIYAHLSNHTWARGEGSFQITSRCTM